MHLLIIITSTLITVIIERGGGARLPTRYGQGSFFGHRAGRGKAKTRRGRAEQGRGLNMRGARAVQDAYCVYQIIEIICISNALLQPETRGNISGVCDLTASVKNR